MAVNIDDDSHVSRLRLVAIASIVEARLVELVRVRREHGTGTRDASRHFLLSVQSTPVSES